MQNLIDSHVKEWKESKYPIIIWGASGLATRIGEFFLRENIDFLGFAVNRQYYDEKKHRLLEHEIYVVEDYVEKNKCNIIIGFLGYDESVLKQLKQDHIVNVYVYDFQGKLAIGEDNTIDEQWLSRNHSAIDELKGWLQDVESVTHLELFLEQKQIGYYKKDYSHNQQYFDEDIIKYSEHEVFLDCGAYYGENSVEFIESLKANNINTYDRIIMVEADGENANIARKRLEGEKKVEIQECGVWDKTGFLNFSGSMNTASRISETGEAKIPVKSIDDIIGEEKVTFIKMDIEGSELKVLEGAKETIKREKPKLAICVYHKPEDLITIPQLIMELNPNYRLYLRNYHASGIETVLYAI